RPLPPHSRVHRPTPPALSPLSLHDALPISPGSRPGNPPGSPFGNRLGGPSGNSNGNRIAVDAHDGSGTAMTTIASNMPAAEWAKDRKSTRLNSSHVSISYAVFCLKKKNYEA